MDPVTGTVHALVSLDYEAQDWFQLQVRATTSLGVGSVAWHESDTWAPWLNADDIEDELNAIGYEPAYIIKVAQYETYRWTRENVPPEITNVWELLRYRKHDEHGRIKAVRYSL